MSGQRREIEVTEHLEVPWLSIVLGYGPMLPFAAGAVASWILDGVLRADAVLFTGLCCGLPSSRLRY